MFKTQCGLGRSLCKVVLPGGSFRGLCVSMAPGQKVPPIVVILGSTGTGKTKLSLELAARYGGEVISADSMQVYKGLDIVTAKATKAEQQQAPHHLLDVATPDQAFTVTHFREKALPIIDSLLAANRMPILVGGTNYYIESVLWKVLIGEGVQRERTRKRRPSEGQSTPVIAEEQEVTETEPEPGLEELVRRLPAMQGSPDALEECGSTLLHRALLRVDPDSANRLHPNNKRKIVRALEVYVESGGQCTMTQMLANQRTAPGACSLGGPLRYRNVVILWLQCNQETLNERLNVRVDGMVAQGLLPEIRTFYETYVKPYNNCNYHRGILQSIGFKEFVKYLQHHDAGCDRLLMEYLSSGQAANSGHRKPDGLDLLNSCLDYLKLVTRRYSRRQLQWIKNRFLCDSGREVPTIYALDTSDVSCWSSNVSNRTQTIIDAVLAGDEPPYACVPKIVSQRDRTQEEKTYHCESCERVIVGEYQWRIHVRSNKHRKQAKAGHGHQPPIKSITIKTD